jgi:hypothetical protein
MKKVYEIKVLYANRDHAERITIVSSRRKAVERLRWFLKNHSEHPFSIFEELPDFGGSIQASQYTSDEESPKDPGSANPDKLKVTPGEEPSPLTANWTGLIWMATPVEVE